MGINTVVNRVEENPVGRAAGPVVRVITLCDSFSWENITFRRGDSFRARVCVDLITAKAAGRVYFNYPRCPERKPADGVRILYTGTKNAEHLPRPDYGKAWTPLVPRCVPAIFPGPVAEKIVAADPDFQILDSTGIYVGGNAQVGDFDSDIAPLLPERPRILFIRDNGAGDVIMSVPAVREFKRRFPLSSITYATLPRHKCLLRGVACIDRVISVHGEMRLDRPGFDLVVNWAGALENYSLERNRGPRIDSFSKHLGLGPLGNKETELHLDEFNIVRAECLLGGAPPKNPGQLLIGYVMQAAAWNRSWPIERVPDLCRLFARALPDCKIVLIDSQADAGFDAPNVINTCGGTHSFMDAAAVCSLCHLVITQDTGLAHACGALGVPALVLIGSMIPEWRFSSYKNFHWILPSDRVPCSPCLDWQRRYDSGPDRGAFMSCAGDRRNRCLEAISPDEICMKAREIIAGSNR